MRRVYVETFSKKRRILIHRRGIYFGKSTDASQYYFEMSISIDLFTIPSAILEMQPRTRENEAGVDSR